MAIGTRGEHEAVPGANRRPPVALLRVDAGLRAAVPPAELPVAERAVVVPGRGLGPGAWPAEGLSASGDAFAALLVRGLVTRETTIAGRRSAELLGPGDVFHPWRSSESAVAGSSRWASDATVVIAVLDGRFLAAARRWPLLFAVIHERVAEQLERATARAAIMALPRVEQRVLGVFWQLAERWGRVRPDGVVLELAITHELIGQLIGAQRPTVTLALQALAQDGLLRRRAHDTWVLAHDARAALPDVPPIGPVQTAASRDQLAGEEPDERASFAGGGLRPAR